MRDGARIPKPLERDYASLYNYIEGNKPLCREETKFIKVSHHSPGEGCSAPFGDRRGGGGGGGGSRTKNYAHLFRSTKMISLHWLKSRKAGGELPPEHPLPHPRSLGELLRYLS